MQLQRCLTLEDEIGFQSKSPDEDNLQLTKILNGKGFKDLERMHEAR